MPSWQFDARDAAVASAVKRRVLDTLRDFGLDDERVHAAELVYGELIGNVVRYTPGTARVTLRIAGDRLLLAVDDLVAPERMPLTSRVDENETLRENGRGLLIIGSLCRQLEVAATTGGKRVTAHIALTP